MFVNSEESTGRKINSPLDINVPEIPKKSVFIGLLHKQHTAILNEDEIEIVCNALRVFAFYHYRTEDILKA